MNNVINLKLDDYLLNDSSQLFSPSLLLFRELLEHNLAETIALCGGPDRWRPHVKTHKTREIVKRQMELGVTKHKCATIAEAEMLGAAQVPDVLIAYPLVGPNIERLSKLIDKFPSTRFATLVDHPELADHLGSSLDQEGKCVDVLLDLNAGMDRTGIGLNQSAIELYEQLSSTPGLRAGGLHWYDGHHRQADPQERKAAVLEGWEKLTSFRDKLLLNGLEVPRIVSSGSGSFAILAQTEEPGLELSPGTTTLFDADCANCFPELNLKPALAVFTRVVSRTADNRLTLDVGHKACAADQPAGKRLFFPALPDAIEVQHTEEHLVLESNQAHQFQLGDGLIAISRHVCPTMNAHQNVNVVEGKRIVAQWKIIARDRVLTI